MNKFNDNSLKRIYYPYGDQYVIRNGQNLQPKQPTYAPIKYSIPQKYIHQDNNKKFVQVPLQMVMNCKQAAKSVNKVIDINLNININDFETEAEKPQINVKFNHQKLKSINNNPQKQQRLPRNVRFQSQTIPQYHQISNRMATIQNSNFYQQKIKLHTVPTRQPHFKTSKIYQRNDLLSRQDYNNNMSQKYVIPPQVVQILTCVICKQRYDVNDIDTHIEKHRKNYQPPKIINNKKQYINMNKQIKPNYRPVLQPQQCYVKAPQNIHIVQKVNKSLNSSLYDNSKNNQVLSKNQEIKLNKVSFAPTQQISNKVTYESNPNEYEIQEYNQNKITLVQNMKAINLLNNSKQIVIQEQNLLIPQKSRNRVSRNLKLNLRKNQNP